MDRGEERVTPLFYQDEGKREREGESLNKTREAERGRERVLTRRGEADRENKRRGRETSQSCHRSPLAKMDRERREWHLYFTKLRESRERIKLFSDMHYNPERI